MNPHHDITRLLDAHSNGDEQALNRLMPVLYDELYRIAHGRLKGERPDHTLNTTALVHETYLKLSSFNRIDWQNRDHFFAIASQCMRNILVDYANRRKAKKRGAGAAVVSLDEQQIGTEIPIDELLTIHDALSRLEELDERLARVVECRFFGGMSIEETANALRVSPATVSRDWTMARAWLSRELVGARGHTHHEDPNKG